MANWRYKILILLFLWCKFVYLLLLHSEYPIELKLIKFFFWKAHSANIFTKGLNSFMNKNVKDKVTRGARYIWTSIIGSLRYSLLLTETNFLLKSWQKTLKLFYSTKILSVAHDVYKKSKQTLALLPQ